MRNGPPTDLVIGVIAAPHGVQGEVRVKIETDFPERFDRGNKLTLRLHGKTREVEIAASREHKGMALLKLQGVNDRNAAEALRGAEAIIPRHAVKPLPKGSWYIFELEGMDVFTRDGRRIGELTEVLHPGGNDVYVVKQGDREILLPAIKQVIIEVDVPGRRMTVDPLEDFPEHAH